MWEAALEPNAITHCSAGASACEKGNPWQQALLLLSETREVKSEPDVISYSTGIRAYDEGDQWQRSLALLGQMREVMLEPSVIFLERAWALGSLLAGMTKHQ
ncbi:unnamed protein product [Prorocentrum cordatum]|uniref:Uncharacterized protein n=1 Tax=Prorocentrum cordatum TaxID=2364126 RepID=A0ABN9SRN5_9DINO|nr:unnamed protein product [Polarella glacialis]